MKKLLLLFLFAVPTWTYADDDCRGHSCNGSDEIIDIDIAGDTLSGGDVTTSTSVTSKNRAFAFAHGMGDVDINDCMGSEQWSTILVGKQKLVANLWCMAESYDARGLHRMAALMRCDIDVISKHFDTNEACVEANTMQPQVAAVDDSWHEEQQLAQYLALNAKVEELEMLYQKASQRPTSTKIVQQKLLTTKQRAALMEEIGEEDEEED